MSISSQVGNPPEKKTCTNSQAEFRKEVRKAGGTPLPGIDFQTFIISLGSSAMHHLGGPGLPVTEGTPRDVEVAHQTIDILGLIETKTRGNLGKEEQALLTNLLCDLRLRYVKALRETQ